MEHMKIPSTWTWVWKRVSKLRLESWDASSHNISTVNESTNPQLSQKDQNFTDLTLLCNFTQLFNAANFLYIVVLQIFATSQ